MSNSYRLDIEKLKRSSIGPLAYLYKDLLIGEDFEYFNEIKHLLVIPDKRKSLDEIMEDHDKKFNLLIEQTKHRFEHLKRKLCYKPNFTTAKIEIIGSGILCASSSATFFTSQVLTPFVGSYNIGGNIIRTSKKPKLISRLITDYLLGWKWTEFKNK
jgi:hypothetical protein